MSSSPTSACRPPAPTKVSRPRAAAGYPPGDWVVVLSHYLEPSYALALFAEGAHGRGYLLKERVSDIDQLVERDPRSGARWLGGRSQGRRRACRREVGPGRRLPA